MNSLSSKDPDANIHRIGTIQADGILVIVRNKESSLKIIGYSENFIGSPLNNLGLVDHIWDRSLSDVLGEFTSRQIEEHVGVLLSTSTNIQAGFGKRYIRTKCSERIKINADSASESEYILNDKFYCGSVSRCSEGSDEFLVEFEEMQPSLQPPVPNATLLQSSDLTSRVNRGMTVEEVTAAFCDAILNLLGKSSFV
jgi:hypothetical protein